MSYCPFCGISALVGPTRTTSVYAASQAADEAPVWPWVVGILGGAGLALGAAVYMSGGSSTKARTARPNPFNQAYTVADAKRLVQGSGGHWFDKAAMRFFNSRVGMSDRLIGGKYFVSGERRTTDEPLRYTVRELVERASGEWEIKSASDFQQYSTRQQALKVAESLAMSVGPDKAGRRNPVPDVSERTSRAFWQSMPSDEYVECFQCGELEVSRKAEKSWNVVEVDQKGNARLLCPRCMEFDD